MATDQSDVDVARRELRRAEHMVQVQMARLHDLLELGEPISRTMELLCAFERGCHLRRSQLQALESSAG